MEKCNVMNFKKSSLKCWSTLIGSKLNAAFLSRSPGLHCYWLNENICLLFSCGQNNWGKKIPPDNRLLIRKEENTLEICYWCFSWGYIQYFLFFLYFFFISISEGLGWKKSKQQRSWIFLWSWWKATIGFKDATSRL